MEWGAFSGFKISNYSQLCTLFYCEGNFYFKRLTLEIFDLKTRQINFGKALQSSGAIGFSNNIFYSIKSSRPSVQKQMLDTSPVF